MQPGMIGLGRMGGNIARRLRREDIDVVAWNRNPETARALAHETGLTAAKSTKALAPPCAIWLMLATGAVTEEYIERLAPRPGQGDLVVDGANSHYRDSMRRAEALAARNIEFVDAGVSRGIHGLAHGYALMLGDSAAAVGRLRPVLEVLAPAADRGSLHCGPVGAEYKKNKRPFRPVPAALTTALAANA